MHQTALQVIYQSSCLIPNILEIHGFVRLLLIYIFEILEKNMVLFTSFLLKFEPSCKSVSLPQILKGSLYKLATACFFVTVQLLVLDDRVLGPHSQ